MGATAAALTLANDVFAGGGAWRDATDAVGVEVAAGGVTGAFAFADRFGRDSLVSLDV